MSYSILTVLLCGLGNEDLGGGRKRAKSLGSFRAGMKLDRGEWRFGSPTVSDTHGDRFDITCQLSKLEVHLLQSQAVRRVQSQAIKLS